MLLQLTAITVMLSLLEWTWMNVWLNYLVREQGARRAQVVPCISLLRTKFLGRSGIVGGQTPLGLGIAYAIKYKGTKGACLCFMGDGATNQGPFYESLNLASLWNLPVVYIIENNGYSMGTAESRHSAGEPLARRGDAFDINWSVHHGHDLYEVRAAINEALNLAKESSKPSVLEIITYRYRGHSVADPDQTYRSKEEIEEYKRNKDPINLFLDKLVDEGILNDEHAKALDQAAKDEAEASAEFALW